MMGSGGELSGYHPTDSNGLSVSTTPPAACVCVIYLQSLCAPLEYGGCGGRCEETPPMLPPQPPTPGPMPPEPPKEMEPLFFWGVGTELVARCILTARKRGLQAIADCRKTKNNHPHCDKLGHCVAACVLKKCAGPVITWCLGWLRDPPLVGDPADRAANWAGEQCAGAGGSCRNCCNAWWEHVFGPNPCPTCRPILDPPPPPPSPPAGGWPGLNRWPMV